MADPDFGPQLIGRTEKALNAILLGLLGGTGVAEPGWVALQLVGVGGEGLDLDELGGRLARVLGTSDAVARTRVTELRALGLVHFDDHVRSSVTLTADGRELVRRVRADVDAVTTRLWGDLPAQDLAVAGRVLSIVLTRAELETATP